MRPSRFACPLSAVLLGLAGVSIAAGPLSSQVLTTTLCEIHRNPMKYNGKMVKIEAPYYGGLHGMALVDENCPEIKTDRKTIPPGIDIEVAGMEDEGEKPVGFTLNQSSWEAFSQFLKTVKRFEPVLVTLVGQIRVKKGFHLKEFGDGLAGSGYGNRGLYRLQIVVQSVEHFAEMKGNAR